MSNNQGIITPFVKIKPSKQKGFVEIEAEFSTYWKLKENGVYTCYIPAFEIYFDAKDRDTLDRKSIALTKIFVKFYADDYKKAGILELIRQLRRLGFDDTNMPLYNAAHKRPVDAIIRNRNYEIPEDFLGAQSQSFNSKLQAVV